MRIPYISLLAAGALALSGCAYGDLGYGVGYGGGYGAYDYGYGYGAYGGYGAYPAYYGGFGAPYFGWYDDFYYPGTGVFVYDSYRRPHRWSSSQRAYWSSRQGTGSHSANWSGFHNQTTTTTYRHHTH